MFTIKDKTTSFSYLYADLFSAVRSRTSLIARKVPEMMDNVILSSDDSDIFEQIYKSIIPHVQEQLTPFQRGIDVPFLDRVPTVVYPLFNNQHSYSQGDKMAYTNLCYQAKENIIVESVEFKNVGMPIGNDWSKGIVAKKTLNGSTITNALIAEALTAVGGDFPDMDWYQANARRHDNWRLPSKEELNTILLAIPDPFTTNKYFWSSDIDEDDNVYVANAASVHQTGEMRVPKSYLTGFTGFLCRSIEYGFNPSQWIGIETPAKTSEFLIFPTENYDWRNLNSNPTTDNLIFEALVNGILANWLLITFPQEAEVYNSIFANKLREIIISLNKTNGIKRNYSYP